jgi:hypothetical protein
MTIIKSKECYFMVNSDCCEILKLIVCILLRVLGHVQGLRLTQEDGHKTETCSDY